MATLRPTSKSQKLTFFDKGQICDKVPPPHLMILIGKFNHIDNDEFWCCDTLCVICFYIFRVSQFPAASFNQVTLSKGDFILNQSFLIK